MADRGGAKGKKKSKEASDKPDKKGAAASAREIVESRESIALDLINADRPLKELAQHFESQTDALVHYAGIMRGKYRAGRSTSACEACGKGQQDSQNMYHWRAPVKCKVPRSSGKPGEKTRYHTIPTAVTFETFHWVCRRCKVETAVRRLLAAALTYLSITLLFVCILSTVIYLNELIAIFVQASRFETMNPQHVMILAGAMLGAIPALLGILFARAIGAPRLLRSIGKWPFSLTKVSEI